MQFQSFTKIFKVTFPPLFGGMVPLERHFLRMLPQIPPVPPPPPYKNKRSLRTKSEACLSVREANYKPHILTGGRGMGPLVS